MNTKSHDVVIIICVLFSHSIVPLSAFTPPLDAIWTQRRSVDDDFGNDVIDDSSSQYISCGSDLRSAAGSFTYVSGGGQGMCALYLLAEPDQLLEVSFPVFDVSCGEDSALALLDGWDVDGQLFPSREDHGQPMDQRYLAFCGAQRPPHKLISKQNLMQILFQIPEEGEGFVIDVVFRVNPKPCNMLLWSQLNENVAVSNHGAARNCTVMSLYPQRVQFLYVSVGKDMRDSWLAKPSSRQRKGLKPTCASAWGEDAVRVYTGVGVGPAWRSLVMGFCGEKVKASRPVPLLCHTSSVTVTSSGQFYNKVIFSFLPALPDDPLLC